MAGNTKFSGFAPQIIQAKKQRSPFPSNKRLAILMNPLYTL
jgi:hypothetical protein